MFSILFDTKIWNTSWICMSSLHSILFVLFRFLYMCCWSEHCYLHSLKSSQQVYVEVFLVPVFIIDFLKGGRFQLYMPRVPFSWFLVIEPVYFENNWQENILQTYMAYYSLVMKLYLNDTGVYLYLFQDHLDLWLLFEL